MGLEYGRRPVLTDPKGLSSWELWALSRVDRSEGLGEMLHIQEDVYLGEVSRLLEDAREDLGELTFDGDGRPYLD